MKLSYLTAGLILCLFLLTGCGKEAEEKNTSDNKDSYESSKFIEMNALKEIVHAVETNNLEGLKTALKKAPRTDLNQLLDDGETLLTRSIQRDYRAIGSFLLSQGASAKQTNANKKTPLMMAVIYYRIRTVRLLIGLDCAINAQDLNGNTALIHAIKGNNDEAGLLIVKHGADLDINNKDAKTAYRLTSEYEVPKTAELMKTVLQAEIGTPDINKFRSILLQGDIQSLNVILNSYPNLVKDYEVVNPLAVLVDVPDENLGMRNAELLLNYRVNVNGPADAEQTPLLKAIIKRKRNFAQFLLISRADPQMLDKEGRSPLIHAVELNDPTSVDLLLSYSAAQSYTVRINGKKLTFDACRVASRVNNKLKDSNEIAKIKKIQKSLRCTLFSATL